MDVSAIQLKTTLEANADNPVVSHGAAERFQALMQVGPTAAPEQAAGNLNENPVAAMANAQDAAIRNVSNDVMWLGDHMRFMPIDRVVAASILVQAETASLTVNMQVKMAAVTASKDAVSTLMKNQ